MEESPVVKSRPSFPIVGIGASAGGLESFSGLLKAMPTNTGIAFVIIQHLDPSHESYLRTALAKSTSMPVIEISHGIKLVANQVYVLPSNVDLEIEECELHIIPRDTTSGALHMPIDTFLKSLAKNCEQRAIGVVLSGNGNDGTEGLKSIKNEGGFTFVQDPSTAKNPSMPESAILAHVVDFSLPLPQLAQELSYLAHHEYYDELKGVEPLSSPEEHQDFLKVLLILKREQNVDFGEYKDATVKRRLVRRMAFLRIETLPLYIKYLQENPQEPHTLLEDILIHVTSFFRDPEAFQKLQKKVFPQLMKDRDSQSAIRIWVAGCSTGEEVYSLVISLLEYLGESAPRCPIQVFGSDISEKMIEICRAGFYPDTLVKGLSPERLKRFFVKVDHGYRINKVVRDLCVFVRHDLARDPPFSRLDLITCRNVLIYFDKPLQKRLMSTFHYCLKEPGYLLLGRTENVSGHQHFFSTEDKVNKIFSRTPIQSQLRFQMPKETTPQTIPLAPRPFPEIQPPNDISKTIDNILLLEYAPCGVLINDRMEVLQYRGKTSDYLEQPPGVPETNLLKMVREGIFVELQIALIKAKKESVPVEVKDVKVKFNDNIKICNIIVRPVTEHTLSVDTHFLVLFEEVKLSPQSRTLKGFFTKPSKSDLKAEEIRSVKLEKELAVTKEYLKSLNDQHEKTNNALATANEEFVSGNEELQSMNEELETAKEELQSINEELTTVNDELQNSNQEVGQINNDLVNLLNSVEIPIVILDVNRKIRRFTPHARSIVNLLITDIGRSIDDIKLNILVNDLEGQIKACVATDEVKESEVQNREGKWYRLQIRPYKTQENTIEGCVISLFDINTLRREVNKAEWARDYATSIVEGIQIPLVVLDKSLRVISANKAFYKLFNVAEKDSINQLLISLDITSPKTPLGEMLINDGVFLNEEIQRDCPGMGMRTMSLSAQPIVFDSEVSNMILLAIEDITIRKNQELEKARLLFEAIKSKRESEEASKQLRIVADAVPIHLIHMDKEERFLFLNKCAADMWDKTIEEMVGKTIKDIAGAEMQRGLSRYTKRVLKGEFVSYESDFTTPKGSVQTFLNTYTPDINQSGEVQGFVVAGTDITERKKIEQKLTETVESLAQERELRERFIAALSHDLRTPLAVARLGGEMLVRKTLDQLQLQKISDKIVKNMDRADGMIRDLLDANKLKAGEKLHLEMQECDLNKITHEVIEDLKNIHGDRFTFEAEEQINGFWDSEAIRRILENLLSNAVKYGDHYSPVKIILSNDKANVEMAVHNMGNPILKDDQKNIFEVFQRSESASKGGAEGWGIGLSLIKGLARAHGGDVTVKSSESEGTTFTVTILQDSRVAQF